MDKKLLLQDNGNSQEVKEISIINDSQNLKTMLGSLSWKILTMLSKKEMYPLEIAKQLGIDEAKITLQSKLNEDLGADSLDSVQVIMALEEEFGIEILDEDAEKIKTIEDIVRYLTDREKNDKTPSGG